MRKLLLIFSTVLLCQSALAANNFIPKAQVKNAYSKILCKNKKSSFIVNYPQVYKISNKKIEKNINTYLKKEFTKPKMGKCEDFTKDDKYKSETTYKITNNNKGILSVYYDNLAYMEKSAHPSNLYQGYSISLSDGKIMDFNSLFNKNTKYLDKINSIIKDQLKVKKITSPFSNKKNYDFYLTDKELVIINIFESHAIRNFKLPIKYSSIKNILDKNSAVQKLAK